MKAAALLPQSRKRGNVVSYPEPKLRMDVMRRNVEFFWSAVALPPLSDAPEARSAR